MPSTFFSVVTVTGQAKMANIGALGGTLNLSHMAVGDGNGNPTVPTESQTALVRERYRAEINQLNVDPNNPNRFYADLVIPSVEGGWTIHEVALFANDGSLFAVGNFPATYKPVLSEGTGAELLVRIYVQVANVANVTLQIDPTVVLASRQWVTDNFTIAEQIPGGLTGQILRKKTNTDGDVEWFDPAAGFSVYVEVIEEHQTLATSQVIVDLLTVTTDGLAVYIDGLRTFDFTVNSDTRITLDSSYPNGTKIDLVQNDPTAETADIDLRVNRTIQDAGLTLNTADITQLTTALQTLVNQQLVIPAMHINGMLISNNAVTPATKIDISAGACSNAAGTRYNKVASAFTKDLNAAWAVGTGNGGLFSGTKQPLTTYHIFLIRKTVDGSLDYGFDTSISGANVPSGWTIERRIGSIITKATSGDIPDFNSYELAGGGLEIRYKVAAGDRVSGTVGSTATLITLSVPTGRKFQARSMVAAAGSNDVIILISSPDDNDETPDLTLGRTNLAPGSNGPSDENGAVELVIHTNTSGQIRARTYSGNNNLRISTRGYIDSRR